MAKKALLTIDGVYRKVKSGYLTVDGVYHKVKKAFITVGGVYRPCWSEGMGIAYYGQITPLSLGGKDFGTASNGTCALFAGGMDAGGWCVPTVEGYDASLVRKSTASSPVTQLQGGRIGNVAIFQGGLKLDDEEYEAASNTAYRFDASLSRSISASGHSRFEHKAALAGDRLVFHGGRYINNADGDEWWLDYCDAYTESLTHTSNYYSNYAEMRFHAGASVGNYALFGGGYDWDDLDTNTIAAVNSSLQFSQLTMSVARYAVTATNVGNHALFIGGFSNYLSGTCDIVDAFDTSLTRTIATPISTASEGKTSTTIQVGGVEYAVIAGGASDLDNVYDVDVYDSSLTRTTYYNMFNEDYCPYGGYGRSNSLTPVGNYILYAKNDYDGRVDALVVT
jgi:hypothetical protein